MIKSRWNVDVAITDTLVKLFVEILQNFNYDFSGIRSNEWNSCVKVLGRFVKWQRQTNKEFVPMLQLLPMKPFSLTQYLPPSCLQDSKQLQSPKHGCSSHGLTGTGSSQTGPAYPGKHSHLATEVKWLQRGVTKFRLKSRTVPEATRRSRGTHSETAIVIIFAPKRRSYIPAYCTSSSEKDNELKASVYGTQPT